MPQNDLFTWTSLGNYSGLSLAVIVVTNGLSLSLQLKETPPWLGLVVSLVICLLVTAAVNETKTLGSWELAILNAFFVYATAIGGNAMGQKVEAVSAQGRHRGLAPERGQVSPSGFFRKWL